MEHVSETEQMICLNAHANCIWGDLSAEDRLANENALLQGGRIISTYTTRTGVKLQIVTEANRSCTTLLLRKEY